MAYEAGTTVKLTAYLRDINGDLVDPDTVTMYVASPSGTVTAFVYGTDSEIAKGTTGTYHLTYPINISAERGEYQYGIYGTGTYDITESDGRFWVKDFPFT